MPDIPLKVLKIFRMQVHLFICPFFVTYTDIQIFWQNVDTNQTIATSKFLHSGPFKTLLTSLLWICQPALFHFSTHSHHFTFHFSHLHNVWMYVHSTVGRYLLLQPIATVWSWRMLHAGTDYSDWPTKVRDRVIWSLQKAPWQMVDL